MGLIQVANHLWCGALDWVDYGIMAMVWTNKPQHIPIQYLGISYHYLLPPAGSQSTLLNYTMSWSELQENLSKWTQSSLNSCGVSKSKLGEDTEEDVSKLCEEETTLSAWSHGAMVHHITLWSYLHFLLKSTNLPYKSYMIAVGSNICEKLYNSCLGIRYKWRLMMFLNCRIFFVLHILLLPEAALVHSKRTDISDDHT